ncbi:MAG TPA: sigma factor-like helix-turn-helix DNA-binding protein [Terracidiphilus sp.]|nr:sigma factor-like helix-turn-helix DNA-binding protein [Terracidiphilus sp.]
MSAALVLPEIWAEASLGDGWQIWAAEKREEHADLQAVAAEEEETHEPSATQGLGFYRRHTETMLRRYLYASMQVGRAPSILADPVARGMVSCRTVKTFEDAVIFVLDVERCLDKLDVLDKQLLSRIVLQDYTQYETAALLGMSVRSVGTKYRQAVDHLTEKLMKNGLLVIPHS